MKKIGFVIVLAAVVVSLSIGAVGCKKGDGALPEIKLIAEPGNIKDGDTVAIGHPIRFTVEIVGKDANITNFTVKKVFDGKTKSVLDSGMNSSGFVKSFTFYQSIEDEAEWVVSVMDRNRGQASVSFTVHKDPSSQFGGIQEWKEVRLGYQESNIWGQFFLKDIGKVYFEDSASLFQEKVDFLVYFNHKEDNGILKPSPTFSSPGEEPNCSGELYNLYYPFLCNWSARNYTKYDIRAINDITPESYDNAHNDSLLIVSYDDVWGKKKYKWANSGLFIPFQTADGKKGIIKIVEADTVDTGSILFSMKVQL